MRHDLPVTTTEDQPVENVTAILEIGLQRRDAHDKGPAHGAVDALENHHASRLEPNISGRASRSASMADTGTSASGSAAYERILAAAGEMRSAAQLLTAPVKLAAA
jgi:hypothetical protein